MTCDFTIDSKADSEALVARKDRRRKFPNANLYVLSFDGYGGKFVAEISG
ncbi:MAG: hypothetical protein JWQ42_905 [Edaphobacter sp.]|jgi:hypothetical protein|nr:hypothetical protein [Edaphobacter sp.]